MATALQIRLETEVHSQRSEDRTQNRQSVRRLLHFSHERRSGQSADRAEVDVAHGEAGVDEPASLGAVAGTLAGTGLLVTRDPLGTIPPSKVEAIRRS